MNRRQRRAAEKELGVADRVRNAPLAPLAPKVGMKDVMNLEIKKALDLAVTQSNNDTLNLVSSAFLIVLKEFHDIECEALKEILAQVFEQLELCGTHLVSIDEMMDLCKSYGIETFIDEVKMNELGKKMFQKQKVFEQLDKGLTEIEDIHKATGVSSKEVSAFRWEYNTKKYGGFEMSKLDEIIKMFEAGVTDLNLIAKKTGLKESSVKRYFATWKQSKPKDDIDILADAVFGTDKVDEVETAPIVCEESIKVDQEVVADEHIADTGKKIDEEKPKMTLNIPGKKKGPKITRKVEIEGEFGSYIIENRVADCHIACATMALEKQQLLELIEELQVVAGEIA